MGLQSELEKRNQQDKILRLDLTEVWSRLTARGCAHPRLQHRSAHAPLDQTFGLEPQPCPRRRCSTGTRSARSLLRTSTTRCARCAPSLRGARVRTSLASTPTTQELLLQTEIESLKAELESSRMRGKVQLRSGSAHAWPGHRDPGITPPRAPVSRPILATRAWALPGP